MRSIKISGGYIYRSCGSGTVEVISGNVLVYLIPEKNGTFGRRFFLKEFEPGSIIPEFICHSEVYGSWHLGFAAADKAELTIHKNADRMEAVMKFASVLGLQISSEEEFMVEIIEMYNINAVKEEGYIYINETEQKKTMERTLGIIYDFFQRKPTASGIYSDTGNALYDTAAYICRHEKISIAPLDSITEGCGRHFGIADISRISHFTIREVLLENNWHRQDNGALLVYFNDGRPAACIPVRPGKYIICDPQSKTAVKLTSEITVQLKAKAYMFYRPFPDKVISKKDLISFGLECIKGADVMNMLLCALLGTLTGLMIPYMNEAAYDMFIPMGSSSGLFQLGAVILSCSMGSVSFAAVKNIAVFRIMNSMEYAAQGAAFDRLYSLPSDFYRRYAAAELGQKVMGVSDMYDLIAGCAAAAVLSAVFSLLYLGQMVLYSPQMTLTAAAMVFAVMTFIAVLGIRQVRYERDKRNIDINSQSDMFQYLRGISKLRISGAENRALYRYLCKFTRSRRINSLKERMTNLADTVMGAAQTLFPAVFFKLIADKDINMSVGEFAGFSAAFGAFSGACITLVQCLLKVNSIKPIYDDVRPILETLPENPESCSIPGKLTGAVEISSVTFGYNSTEEPVLKNIDLNIRAGEYVGVVGASGCGKSTLLKILLGFEKPQIGKVYYDNRDIEELDKRELRKKFGVVLQDDGLISGSIYENITIASRGCKMSKVNDVIRRVGLEEDIQSMPMGVHTVIAEGSGTISGGQRQRILIARALVNDPKIIFLDEATSALDNVTQSMVVETLEKINSTKIVIAHRLSTVRKCDRIIVMDKGEVAEMGTYDELMEKHGLFFRLAERQI